jgi:GT2 family glycosyltransferase
LDISIVILNYNVKFFLENCIKSVIESAKGFNYEIIVADNNSSDGSKEYIEQRFPDVKYIFNNENLGFAKGNNVALRVAKGRYILILNPDTLLKSDTLKNCINYMDSSERYDMISCKVVTPDGKIDPNCHRSFPTPWNSLTHITKISKIFKNRLFSSYNMLYADDNSTFDTDVISGSFMLFRRKILDDGIYMPEEYFMYGEDIDFCFQIKRRGYKIGYLPIAECIHYRGQSTKNVKLSMKSHFYRSMNIFIEKNYSKQYSLIFKSALNLGIFIGYIVSILSIFTKTFLLPIADIGSYLIGLIVGTTLYNPIAKLILNVEVGNNGVSIDKYYLVSFIYISIILAVCSLAGNYGNYKFSIKRVLFSLLMIFLATTSVTFFLKSFAFSRIVLFIMMITSLSIMVLWRVAILKKISLFHKRTMIVGIDNHSKDLINYQKLMRAKGLHLTGLIDKRGEFLGKSIGEYPIYGNVKDIEEIIKLEKLDHLIFSIDSIDLNEILTLKPILDRCKVTFSILIEKHNPESKDLKFMELSSKEYF